MPCLQRGHLRSFLVCSHIYKCQLLGMYSLSLNESELSYAQQFLSSRDMFEIDNYQRSLIELDSYLFFWSLSNEGFVSNYPYTFVKTILIVGLHLNFKG